MKNIKKIVRNYEFMRLIMSSISKHRKFQKELVPDVLTTQLILDDLENYPLEKFNITTEQDQMEEQLALLQFFADYEECPERYPGYFKHIISEFKKRVTKT